jgi:tRNA modification GTPase
VSRTIEKLLSTADQGRIVREGIKVVLCGKPNVGKSSLLNVLLRQPRAIVSQIEGTTRDAVEESAQIGGIPFQMVDTAGILSPRDEIEEEAVKRSQMHIDEADLVLFLLDASAELNDQDFDLARRLAGKNVLVVLNKIDLIEMPSGNHVTHILPDAEVQCVSTLTQQGLEGLCEAILRNILHGKRLETDNIVLSNIRHIDLLKKCLSEIRSILQDPDGTPSLEFVSEHIKQAVHELDRITGRDADADLVDQIFSEFCIGK